MEEPMTALLIDGKQIAADTRAEIKAEVEEMKAETGQVPGLATVLVGTRKDSQTYVKMKKRACKKAGIASFGHHLPEDISREELLEIVHDLNANPGVHGILVQLPLPAHIDEETILSAVSLEKDVDGFHPINIGRLSMKRREPLFVPCTPKGCIELLDRTGVEIEGKRAVVLGRSNIVGLPAAMLLLHRNATVTICHSRTEDLPSVVREADILVAAVGRAEMVRGDWVKPGAVVIDVGMNAVDDPNSEKGYRLTGDVAFDEVKEVAAAITPVPGGVGPMTIAMLLKNTLHSAKQLIK
jgi:5,10-methylene-tetrahydrofolate dehydrogenase/methenyl tetrahydrofolate cyclohydrolase